MHNKVPKNEYLKGKPGKKQNPYKKDVIYDPRGQWDYPGEVTKIPSGTITMQGVPYPVLGVDNLGYEQMMYPGLDYQFPGDTVTEYPMFQKGGQPKPIIVFDPNDPILKEYEKKLKEYNSFQFPPKGYVPVTSSKDKAAVDFVNNTSGDPADYWYNPTGSWVGTPVVSYFGPLPKKPTPVIYQKPEEPKPAPAPAPVPTEPSTKYAYMPTNWGPTYYYEWDAQQKKWIPISQQSYNYNTEGGTKNTQLYSSTPPGFQYGGDPSIPELNQAKKGGWLNKYSKMPKKTSSKNIKTSINKLMVKNPLFERNYMLYGAKGPRLYDPSSKYKMGGWLDSYQGGGQNKPSASQEWIANNPGYLPSSMVTIIGEDNKPKQVRLDSQEYSDYWNKHSGKILQPYTTTPTEDNPEGIMYQAPTMQTQTVTDKATGSGKHVLDFEKKEGTLEEWKAKQKETAWDRMMKNMKNVSYEDYLNQRDARLTSMYEDKKNNYVAGKILKDKPKGNKSRADWNQSFTPAERYFIDNSNKANKIKPNIFQTTAAGISRLNMPQIPGLNPFDKAIGLTPEESKNISGANALDILSYPTNVAWGALYDPEMSFGDALSGQQTDKIPLGMQIAGDPLNLLGIGLVDEGADVLKGVSKARTSNVGYKFPKYPLQSSKTQVGIDPVHYRAVDAVKNNSSYRWNYYTGEFESGRPRSSILVNPQFGHDYVLPEGMGVDELNSFTQRAQNGFVESNQIDDVYESLIKLNPELKNTNVNKLDLIGGVSSHIAPQDLVNIKNLPPIGFSDPSKGFFGNLKAGYQEAKWKQFTDENEGFDFRFSPERQKEIMRTYKPTNTPTQLPGSPNVQQAGFSNPLAIADRIIPRPPSPGSLLGMEDSWNYWSPLNYIPGYGKKLIAAESSYPNIIAFRKFGNSLDDVIKSQSLRPRGTGMGSKQIMGEGNWAEPGKVNENYPGVFAAEMDPQNPGSNIKLEYWPNRAGVVGTTKEGNVAIPLTDEGLQFHRRLPFSSRYIPINKQKLINNQFQLATQLPHVQSLVEKYGLYAGLALVSGYMMGGKEQALKNLETVNKYSIDPVINWTKKQWNEFDKLINPSVEQKKAGGSTRKSGKKLVNYTQKPNFVKTQSTSWLDKYK